MSEQTVTEKFTVTSTFVENLMKQEFQRGKTYGAQTAKSLALETIGYGSHVRQLGTIYAKTRRELSRKVKECYWRRYGDNPGQAYSGDCQLLRATKTDNGTWEGIVIFSTFYDV